MSINPSQKEAILFGDGPAMVLAGPGSGKTTVITHRIRLLIEKHGVDPSQILVITFTRAAAVQMQERFIRLMNGARPPVSFGTFHAIFFKILKHAYGYNGSHILRSEQKLEFLRDAMEGTELPSEEEGDLIQALMAEIGEVKGDGVTLESYHAKCCPDDVFRSIYEAYNARLRREGLLDFDDMVGLCYELFQARPDILQAWQRKYKHLLIDEFQDINRLQYQVVRMLAAPENNLFIVGDDDQSIYRFRGARPEIMLGFPGDYPDCRQILLDINYRSTPQIVDTALRLIGQNNHRFRKRLKAFRGGGPAPVFTQFPTVIEENDRTLQELQAYHRRGIPYEEMALLYRTNRTPRAMVEQLLRMNLPFQMGDLVPNIYEHWIAGDLITYMKVAAGERRRRDVLRIINRPKRYIRRDSLQEEQVDLEQLKQIYKDQDWVVERLEKLEYDLRMIGKMAPFAAIQYIRHGVGYEEFLREYAEFRRMKPDELLEILDELQESAGRHRTLAEWLDYIQQYTKDLSRQKGEKEEEASGITVATMHGSKGLEYQVVFILDANESITPHKRAILPEEIEEERRLFYVAMTRAKEYLHVYWTNERYHKPLPPSRFVVEAGGEQSVPQKQRSKDSKRSKFF